MERRPVAGWELAVGIGVVVMATVMAWQTSEIAVAQAYARVGPKVIPYLVAFGLLGLGILLCIDACRGGWTHEMEDEPGEVDWRAFGWLGLGLLLNVALISWLGFIIASALMFICVARAFGSTKWRRDLIVAVLLCLVAYLGFDKLLGINIGAGVLEGLL